MLTFLDGPYLNCDFLWLLFKANSNFLTSFNHILLFISFPVQLLHKLSIHAADGNQRLLKVGNKMRIFYNHDIYVSKSFINSCPKGSGLHP